MAALVGLELAGLVLALAFAALGTWGITARDLAVALGGGR